MDYLAVTDNFDNKRRTDSLVSRMKKSQIKLATYDQTDFLKFFLFQTLQHNIGQCEQSYTILKIIRIKNS